MSAIKDFAEQFFKYWEDDWGLKEKIYLGKVWREAMEEIEEAAAKGIIPDGMTADEMLFLTKEDRNKETVLAMNRLISLMARGKRVHPLVRELFVALPGREARLECRHIRRGKPPSWVGKKFDIKTSVWDAIRQ